MKILINLIGGQAAPVYIATRIINPDKVLLVYSKESEVQLNRIKNTLNSFNYESLEVSPYDFENCYSTLKNELEKYDSDDFVLNFTSGTKIMSIAAYKLFDESKFNMIYIDSQNHCLLTIDKEKNVNSQTINLKFSVKDYFSIYGYDIIIEQERFPVNKEYRKLNDLCLKNHYQFKSLIKSINSQLKNGNTLIEAKDNSSQCYLRYNFKKRKGKLIIKQGRNTEEIEITSEEMLSYITGYWFEDYIFERLSKSEIFDDIQKNVKIYLTRENYQPEYLNEFDIVAVKDQTLYIYECKTGNLDKNIVEKLRLIKTISGTYSKICLFTLFRPIENSALERIKHFKINLVELKQIDKFISSLRFSADINPSL
ncbi:MAG: hypothetical protein HGGPFJEG_01898 [Ignavibacteria bacterium]|nr:hypothetical protein [Ignavibacteria bacterium]